jgi:hypothetical protein
LGRLGEEGFIPVPGQKKSPSGRRMARTDVETIHRRLAAAREDYEVRYGKKT